MKPKRTVLTATLALTAVLSLLAAGPNSASGGQGGEKPAPTTPFALKRIPASAVHHARQAPRLRNANGTSSNWSGYAVFPLTPSPSGKGKKPAAPVTFTDVTGVWVVPAVTSGTATATYSSAWIGLDGYADSTVEQIGTEQDWSDGSAQYYAWFEMYPKWAYMIVGFPVNPGDRIAAKVEYLSKGAFALTITNLDVEENGTPVSFSITQRAPSAQRLSAEWIMEAPWSGGVLPLANFGTVDFYACSASMNGHTGAIDDGQWQFDAITMETADGTPKAEPSGLQDRGTGFSVTWAHE